jgi:hypothetical protein
MCDYCDNEGECRCGELELVRLGHRRYLHVGLSDGGHPCNCLVTPADEHACNLPGWVCMGCATYWPDVP